MASLTITGLDDVLKQLDKLSDKGRVEAIAKKAVEAATPIVVSSTKAAVGASEYGPRATGSVAASITATPTKINSFGVFAVAKPGGYDSKGRSNVYKASMLENGNVKIGARPWRAKAVASAEGPAMQIMEQIVASEMEAE